MTLIDCPAASTTVGRTVPHVVNRIGGNWPGG
jgi:hypothetical protein